MARVRPPGSRAGLERVAALAVVAVEQQAHARLVVGPVDGAQVAGAVGDDQQFADRRLQPVDQQREGFSLWLMEPS